MKKKLALVFGPGGLTGAFGAGVASELCRQLGSEYFDAIYGSSVGVFVSSYFVANQPEVIEHFWRSLVHGRQLVNPANPLRGRALLDLDYLIEVYRRPGTALDTNKVFSSRTSLVFTVTDYRSGIPVYLAPSPETLFDLQRASCAVPVAYPHPVFVQGVRYVDGGLSDPLPVQRALDDGNDRVVVVSNRAPSETGQVPRFFRAVAPFVGPTTRRLLKEQPRRVTESTRLAQQDARVILIRPPHSLGFRSFLDASEGTINRAVDLGITEARKYIAQISAL